MRSVRTRLKVLFLALIIGFFGIKTIAWTSNDPYSTQWSYEAADVYRAWDYTGATKEVVVAIIDNGFDYTHPDIAPNLWTNAKEIPNNGVDDDRNSYIDDVHGWNFISESNDPLPNVAEISGTDLIHHGTVVAGIIGAVGNNGIDGIGIAQNVKLMNLKVVDSVGSGLLKTVVQAIYYAVDNGAHIINMSMIGSGAAPEVRTAIHYAYEHGVVVVAAAGNGLSDLNIRPDFPVCSDAYDPYTSVIGVSAIDQSRKLAVFSNIGSSCVDITAPGVNISGPLRYAPQKGFSESYSDGWNGTSFAAPFVSAGAALIKSIQPSWNPDQITRTLLSTAKHTPASDEHAYRETYGKGLIQIGAAVEAAESGTVPDARIFVEGEQDISFGVPRRLILSGKTDGSYYEILGENKTSRNSVGMKDIEAITSFRNANGSAFYAVMKPKNKTERYISIYDYDWVRRFRWSFDTHGRNYEILAADILGDTEKEIILVATNTGREEILVFHVDGTFIANLAKDRAHLGATATVKHNYDTNSDELLYAYRAATDSVALAHITYGQKLEEMFLVPLRSLGGVAYLYNIDSSQESIVFGSNSGTSPLVTIVALADGAVIGTFRPYDLSFRGGVKVFPLNYGLGGIEHIAVLPKQGVYSLRIFDSQGSLQEDLNVDAALTKGKQVVATVAPF